MPGDSAPTSFIVELPLTVAVVGVSVATTEPLLR